MNDINPTHDEIRAEMAHQKERHALMERAFALVKPQPDWKAPIDAYIMAGELFRNDVTMDDVCEAITYFTATSATVQRAGSGWRVWATGYRAGPAGP